MLTTDQRQAMERLSTRVRLRLQAMPTGRQVLVREGVMLVLDEIGHMATDEEVIKVKDETQDGG